MATMRTYIIGYLLSIALTLIAPALIWLHEYNHHRFPTHQELYISVTILALAQLAVQLLFFLHVGRESKPRWNVAALTFAGIVVCILVGGTLWIMHNLANGQVDSMSRIFINSQITPQDEND